MHMIDRFWNKLINFLKQKVTRKYMIYANKN